MWTTGFPLVLLALAVLSLFVPFRSVELTNALAGPAALWLFLSIPVHMLYLAGRIFGRGFHRARRDESAPR
jgi:hypothetical protein